jgi:general secretion pathway protein A
MYKHFFGLHENPFNVNPDPRFLYLTPQIQEALDQLTYGIQNRKGLILLTGEVGTGKTTLINYLLDWLHRQKTPTAFIFNPHLNVKHLFDFILNDFGISTDLRLVSNMLLQLNQWLIERFSAGSTPVLIVDEAQGLSFELLEEIRLLLNLETASEKLLQVVLVGQPELEDKLKRPEMRQLRQRIALRCNTASLTLAESHGYIADRLRIAGATREPVFESDAVEALHSYSRGIPRVMNLLCDHALVNAYVEGLNPVPPQMVGEAARDFLMEEFRPLATYPGMTRRMNSKLSVMHSELAREPGSSVREEAACSLKAEGAERPAAVVAFAEERGPRAGTSMVGAVPEETDAAAAEEHLNTSLSVLDLIPASPEFGTQQVESEPPLNLSAAQFDCAAELVATMGRLLAAASSAPGAQRESSKFASEKSPALVRSRARATENRGLSLDSMNGMLLKSGRRWMHTLNVPWKASWSSLGTRLGPTISTAMRIPAAVLRTTRETMATARAVLRHWVLGFRHDCKVSVNAIGFPQMTKSLGQWLRQPMSKSQSTSSTHPHAQTRRAISAESRFH